MIRHFNSFPLLATAVLALCLVGETVGAGTMPDDSALMYRRRGGDERVGDDRDNSGSGSSRTDQGRGSSGSSSSTQGDDRTSPRPADKGRGSNDKSRDDDDNKVGR